jgi:hypothetical protein
VAIGVEAIVRARRERDAAGWVGEPVPVGFYLL